MKVSNNDLLIELTKDRDLIYKSVLSENNDLDDVQLQALERYDQLDSYKKDVLFLTTKMPVQDIANLYAVSKTYIYSLLKKIRAELNLVNTNYCKQNVD